jgi:hypothetical protein
MSQMMRRILVAASVTLALLLAVPAPSHAARTRRPAPDHSLGLVAQAWSWLESLLGDLKTPTAKRKDIMTTTSPLPPPPSQGPAIDPDGAK